ncbi:hypothetical protein DFP93_11560 [Aneurinibacillus soli]|uniref:Uncharacterized protein n=1 Tax=Aneurinibacillus soli TaxID=1500254 RepID=A0A0U5B4T0_9BACL|nr:hypothetical protein [Aneurinibacillus soli]PYE59902.1 hypothetical protein DFP93_11560 [Aneurinibacillus soli]BAU29376.1 hypothetical protein CB4_03576 [Aneurinibacillus soli]
MKIPRMTVFLFLLACLLLTAGCKEYSTQTVEALGEKELIGSYSTYNKTIDKSFTIDMDTTLAIQIEELSFKKGTMSLIVTDPAGTPVLTKTFQPGSYQDGYIVHMNKKGSYTMTFSFNHVEQGKHTIHWETD